MRIIFGVFFFFMLDKTISTSAKKKLLKIKVKFTDLKS